MINPANIKYYFFYIATTIIIVAGLKAASEVVIVLLLSIFIATIFIAFLQFLRSHKVPKVIAYLISTIIFIAVLVLLIFIFNHSLNNFITSLPLYEEKIKILTFNSINILKKYGVTIGENEISEVLDMNYFAKVTTNILGGIGTFFSKFIIITIGVSFIIAESKSFEKKLLMIFKNDISKLISFKLFSRNMQKYFIVKTFTSFLTGLIFTILLFIFGVEYPILWGVLAFLFNFIPIVGSIIASIPAILLSLINLDINTTLWLISIYVAVNISISNMLEPKLMGRELGLSPMVIFFALIFIGWTLGIAGMFLAVPITMTLKIAFESSNSTRWIAILLSDLSQVKNISGNK